MPMVGEYAKKNYLSKSASYYNSREVYRSVDTSFLEHMIMFSMAWDQKYFKLNE